SAWWLKRMDVRNTRFICKLEWSWTRFNERMESYYLQPGRTHWINVDLFLEMARAYGVRGLRAFARDMRSNWEEVVRQAEGRPDAEQESVSLITVHAAKG